MARIAGIDLPREKAIGISLTYIFGIGRNSALKICDEASVPPTSKTFDLDETEVIRLRDVIERGRDEYGMQSFDQHLTELYRGGIITLEVAKAAASNPSDFERALNFDDSAAPEEFGAEPVGDLSDPEFAGENEKPELESGEELLLSESADGDSLELED